jgi:hypothetical protein
MRGKKRRTPRTFLERKVLGTPKNFRTLGAVDFVAMTESEMKALYPTKRGNKCLTLTCQN